jgi:hypothetical protein
MGYLKIILRTTVLDEVKGHGCAQRAAGPEHAKGLSQDVMRVGYMLEQAVRRDAVDRVVPVRATL